MENGSFCVRRYKDIGLEMLYLEDRKEMHMPPIKIIVIYTKSEAIILIL